MRALPALTACRKRIALEGGETAAGEEADLRGLLTGRPCLRTLEQAEGGLGQRCKIQQATGQQGSEGEGQRVQVGCSATTMDLDGIMTVAPVALLWLLRGAAPAYHQRERGSNPIQFL